MTTPLPGPWGAAVDDWTTAQRVAGLAASTIQLRREQLSLLARWAALRGLGPFDLGTEDLVAWLGSREWAQERRRSVRATLNRFYMWAVASGRLSHNPAAALPVVKAAQPNPRPTPDAVLRRARVAADPRALLILRLACECGLRRAEVARVHTDDLERDLAGWSLVVHGKGRKVRLVPLPAPLAEQLLDRERGFVFPGADHGHLSPRWVGTIMARLLGAGYGMHGLRHRFASVAYQADRDVFTLQAVLGHASPETTRRYVQIPSDAMRRMVERVADASA